MIPTQFSPSRVRQPHAGLKTFLSPSSLSSIFLSSFCKSRLQILPFRLWFLPRLFLSFHTVRPLFLLLRLSCPRISLRMHLFYSYFLSLITMSTSNGAEWAQIHRPSSLGFEIELSRVGYVVEELVQYNEVSSYTGRNSLEDHSHLDTATDMTTEHVE